MPKKEQNMPTNKNAFQRYVYLDPLLADQHHYYDIHDLTEHVNRCLRAEEKPEVDIRTIQKDIKALEGDPFYIDIRRSRENGKSCICYDDPTFSIFNKKLTEDEKNLLRELLNTIGQFDGLDHFTWLEDLRDKLSIKESKKVIVFSNNPYLKNSNLLGALFGHISNEVVIRLSYHTFADDTIRNIDFHPYLLKQYNDRWFLLGASDSDSKILTFALDRIDKVEPLPERKYRKCPEDLEERFEDIVGVTLYEDRPLEHILCWVSDTSKGYIDTKPIHGSYTPIRGEKEQLLREQYPQLTGGMFFSLDCINNYELIRELTSFGKDLLVLSPDSIRQKVFGYVAEQYKTYQNVFTDS